MRCPVCNGSGEHLPLGPSDAPVEICAECQGSGIDKYSHVFFGDNKKCSCHGLTAEDILASQKETELRESEAILRMMHV